MTGAGPLPADAGSTPAKPSHSDAAKAVQDAVLASGTTEREKTDACRTDLLKGELINQLAQRAAGVCRASDAQPGQLSSPSGPSAPPRRRRSAFTQFPNVPSLIPRSFATCATGRPIYRTSRAAPVCPSTRLPDSRR